MIENIGAFTLDKMAREGLSKMMTLKLSLKLVHLWDNVTYVTMKK